MSQRNGARELGLIVAALAVSVHFLPAAPAVAVAILAAIAAAAGTARLIGNWQPWRMPLFPIVLPVLATLSIAGIARVVSPAQWLVLVLPAGWLVLSWVVDLELFGFFQPPPGEKTEAEQRKPLQRIRTRRRPESELPQIVVDDTFFEPEAPPHPRALAVRSVALGLVFMGFVAVGGFVPGALGDAGQTLRNRELAIVVALNALCAGIVGYRIASLVAAGRRDRMVRIFAFGQYAVPVAAGTWLFRTMSLPRLFVPALLTLGVYVITVLRESPEPIMVNRRLLQELAVLGLVAVIAIAWGLMTR
jgi:hypothetical protein